MATAQETTPFLDYGQGNSSWSNFKKNGLLKTVIAVCVLGAVLGGGWAICHWGELPGEFGRDFSSLEGYCKDTLAIQPGEYVDRQKRLAKVLKDEKAGALVVEPGPTMTYYTNIAWSLTERPFLVVLRPDDDLPSGINMTIVTPMFEATRALEALKRANLPSEIEPSVVEWVEDGSPYNAVKKALGDTAGTVFVDKDIRMFVFDGIDDVSDDINVKMAPRSIRTLRMVKSSAEIDILRCANHATLAALQLVRTYVQPGMVESEISKMMTDALETAGLDETWVLALVDENAAFPHGEPGIQRTVTENSTVLIDTGGRLLGYQADVTRTFFLSDRGHNQTIEDAWYSVRRAQENVLNRSNAGDSCAEVDLYARRVIEKAGFGQFFTHRLGHGIGEEMHEEPYMNQGNHEQLLSPGMTFSVEPGIYITGEFGIRLEDIVVVNQEGKLEVLTSGLAQNPWSL
ncbi:peptidase M24, structural domain-containing protein [Phycomyces nitens]|nr:peptidase M24, structural domain-containing protein [Phycomyces nitens]